MPGHLKVIMSYEALTAKLQGLDIRSKKILILGGGFIAKEYCKALTLMRVKNVTGICRSEKTAKACSDTTGFTYLPGGYENNESSISQHYDLAIIALPIKELKGASQYLVNHGHTNILVEKPAALYSKKLEDWSGQIDPSKIRLRVAYNRLVYPSLWKLKELLETEGGITSCRYTFTEWIHTINFEKDEKDCYARWGISNSLHVISMAHYLIGMAKELTAFCEGKLSWHPSGSRFVGAGITDSEIPFSYHADWDSAGRWGIEVMTAKSAYRLIPLEELYCCKKRGRKLGTDHDHSRIPAGKAGHSRRNSRHVKPRIRSCYTASDLKTGG